jgi:hypothetical protein
LGIQLIHLVLQLEAVLLVFVLRQLCLLLLQGSLPFLKAVELLFDLVKRGPAAVYHGATAVNNRLFCANVLPQIFPLLLSLGNGQAV